MPPPPSGPDRHLDAGAGAGEEQVPQDPDLADGGEQRETLRHRG